MQSVNHCRSSLNSFLRSSGRLFILISNAITSQSIQFLASCQITSPSLNRSVCRSCASSFNSPSFVHGPRAAQVKAMRQVIFIYLVCNVMDHLCACVLSYMQATPHPPCTNCFFIRVCLYFSGQIYSFLICTLFALSILELL